MPAKLVFGAGGIGGTEKGFTYTWDTAEKASSLLDTLEKLGLKELDSAASYPPGNPWNTETLLGQTKAVERGFIVDSKVLGARGPMLTDGQIAASVDKTLQLLDAKKLRTLYAHFSDKHTPIEETAKAFDRQYREGKFERVRLLPSTANKCVPSSLRLTLLAPAWPVQLLNRGAITVLLSL